MPEEEINSYFSGKKEIALEALDEVNWWKYRQLNINQFDIFIPLLPIGKSWSSDIKLFGNENSNCIEIILSHGSVIEISARIDLRSDYNPFVNNLCDFAKLNDCVFLNNDLKIIPPSAHLLKQDIINYPHYKSFINKLNE